MVRLLLEAAMRARFSALLAILLAVSPLASAQIVSPQIAPQQLPYHSFVGTFNTDGAIFGTLTLSRNANGAVRGRFVSPVLLNDSVCRGDSNGAGFLITCTQAGKPHVVISAAALPVTLTRQGAPPAPQIRGQLYLVNLGAHQADTPPTMVSFSGWRVS